MPQRDRRIDGRPERIRMPLLEVSGPGEAAQRIRSADKPLTAWAFTSRRSVRRLLSGGAAAPSNATTRHPSGYDVGENSWDEILPSRHLAL